MQFIDKDVLDKIVREKNKIIDGFQTREICLIDLIIKKGVITPDNLKSLLENRSQSNSDYLNEIVKEWESKYKPEKDWYKEAAMDKKEEDEQKL